MKIFLDSSKVEEAKRWMPVIDGATTNPTILLKDGSNIYDFCKFMEPKPVSVEACGDFMTEALDYASKIPNAVIKIPLLKPTGSDNLEVISLLSKQGIQVNCTALFNLSQVILATKVNPRYVSLFVGRVDDEGGDYFSIIEDCINFLEAEDVPTELIVGSIRSVGMVLDAVKAGAHIVTIPPDILKKMLMHRYSLDTVRQFEEDHKKGEK